MIHRERRLSSGTSQGGRQATEGPRTPAWVWLLVLGGFALTFWQFVPKRAGQKPPPAPAPLPLIWLSIFVGVIVIGILALLAWQWLRHRDPGVRRAEKRASEGDLDGVIADLREHIEEKGPTQTRVNALGILLMRRERWDEAAEMFRLGEQIGEFNKGVCRANLGLALLKGGKPAEAIPILQDAARMGPQAPPLTCIINLHMSMALAELNRWDEAEEQFRRAEGAAGDLRKAQRDLLKDDIERCRRNLEQHSGRQSKTEGPAEF
jgi:tetratricopeptide (TPR) repeat protein